MPESDGRFERTGLDRRDRLADYVRACGFDAHAYLQQNADLRAALSDAPAALNHFLEFGCNEDRTVQCGRLPDGLEALSALEIPDRQYGNTLFRSICIAQLNNPGTAERLWQGIGRPTLDAIRRRGGMPYFVIGDSHANHYFRLDRIGEKWLTPLVLVCHGATALDLANANAPISFRQNILRWSAREAPDADIPIFLKFGGLDAEFRWFLRCLKNNVQHFSMDEFEHHARHSVVRYGCFLADLTKTIATARLRVCSVFPSVLPDARWAEGFVRAHRVSPERDRLLLRQLQTLEVPQLQIRTDMRALYNSYLRTMCEESGFIFVDDFTPLLGAGGVLDPRYLGQNGGDDHHVDHDATKSAIMEILRAHLP